MFDIITQTCWKFLKFKWGMSEVKKAFVGSGINL